MSVSNSSTNTSRWGGLVGVDHYWTMQGLPCVDGKPSEYAQQDEFAKATKARFPAAKVLQYRIVTAQMNDPLAHNLTLSHPQFFVRWHNGSVCQASTTLNHKPASWVKPIKWVPTGPADHCDWPLRNAEYDWTKPEVRAWWQDNIIKRTLRVADGAWIDGDGPDIDGWECAGTFARAALKPPYPALNMSQTALFCEGKKIAVTQALRMLIANKGFAYNCIKFVGPDCWPVSNSSLLPNSSDTQLQCSAKIEAIAAINSTTRSIGLFGGRAGVRWPTGGAYNASTAAHAVAVFMLTRGPHWWFILPDSNQIDVDVAKLFLIDYGAPRSRMSETRPGVWQRHYTTGTVSFDCNHIEATLTSNSVLKADDDAAEPDTAGLLGGAMPASAGLPLPPGFATLDCCLRSEALRFGMARVRGAGAQPSAAAANRSMSEALRLNNCSAVQLVSCPPAPAPRRGRARERDTPRSGRLEVHVHEGEDLQAALTELRVLRASAAVARAAALVVHGTHRLTEPLRLGPSDGGSADAPVSIEAADEGGARIVGSVGLDGLDLRWAPAPASDAVAPGTLVASLPPSFAAINSLYQSGRRLTRARFPDVGGATPDAPAAQCTQQPEVPGAEGCCDAACGLPGTGLLPFSAQGWLFPARAVATWKSGAKVLPFHGAKPVDNESAAHGVGGWGSDAFRQATTDYEISAPYAPPVPGFPRMIGRGDSAALDRISGLAYDNRTFSPRRWSNASTGVVHMQHGFFWGSWQFKLRGRDHAAQQLSFWYGGYQSSGWASGGPWFVENLKEELTEFGEWFHEIATNRLFLFPNSTAAATAGIEAVVTRTLIKVGGASSAQPVHHVSFRGLRFEQTSTTFLEPYVMPSGGDYRIFSGGAIEVRNAANVSFTSNTFSDLGGNALFLGGYVRHCNVSLNEFVRIGDSAVLSVGTVSRDSATDGSWQTSPSDNLFKNNHIHRYGMYGKQNAGFMQAVACGSVYRGNVVYDGPRHAFSWNDHFGGGTIISENLLFNQMKESRVGGNFNDWDRSAFWQRQGCAPHGAVTSTPGWNTIRKNFMLNGYAAHANLDHDDGGRRYADEDNLLAYGTMENHDGTDKLYRGNLVVFPGVVGHSQYGKPCFEDTPDSENSGRLKANNTLIANTCWLSSDDATVLANMCNVSESLATTVSVRSYRQAFFTPSGAAGWKVRCNCAPTPGSPKTCQGHQASKAFNYSLQQWQAGGVDVGSTVAPLPPPQRLLEDVIRRARALLEY